MVSHLSHVAPLFRPHSYVCAGIHGVTHVYMYMCLCILYTCFFFVCVCGTPFFPSGSLTISPARVPHSYLAQRSKESATVLFLFIPFFFPLTKFRSPSPLSFLSLFAQAERIGVHCGGAGARRGRCDCCGAQDGLPISDGGAPCARLLQRWW